MSVEKPGYEVRLVCRLGRDVQGLDELLKFLREAGWRLSEDKVLEKGSCKMRLKEVSLAGDEAIFHSAGIDSEMLEDFVRVASRGCWYLDIYYHLRGEYAGRAAESLGINLEGLEENIVREVKLSGASLRLSIYPKHRILTVSYRVGWSEVNRGIIPKIHEKLLEGASKPNEKLSRKMLRLLGWG